MNTAIVASIQYAPILHDVARNLATATQMAFEAAGKGAAVIVLPELCIGGSVLENKREAANCAQTRDGYQTEAFYEIARQFNCHVVFGYVELDEGRFYNSAAIVGPQGLVGNAQKKNLYGSDQLWAESSEQMSPVVVTRAGRLGTLICRDASNNFRQSYKFYKAESRFYKKGSVDTIALITNWGPVYSYPDSQWVELAEETGANVVVSNRVGAERDQTFKGGSCCIDRTKKVWTNGSSFTEAAVVGGVVLL